MTEGTRSIVHGCHSVIHSVLVLRSWKILYGSWPALWQVVCIFLHDIGHFGLNYLSKDDEKLQHWVLGARIGGWLFGVKGFDLIAGHTEKSGFPLSDLKKPDKFSWIIAPSWWLM